MTRWLPALAAVWDVPGDVEAVRLLARQAPDGALAVMVEPAGAEALLVADLSGMALPLDPCLARALAALSRHEDALEAARERPVTHADLVRALASAETTTAVSSAFAAARAGPRIEGAEGELLFEPGGIAYLREGRSGPVLDLIAVEDPVHRIARALVAAREDPVTIPALLAARPLFSWALDPNGLLRAFLERHPPGPAYDARARKGLDLVTATLAANAADSYGVDDEGLALAVARAAPRGRYVGLWHGHPGHVSGEPPSDEDRSVAAETGRFLTFVERRTGFELHDLRPDDLRPEPVPVPISRPGRSSE